MKLSEIREWLAQNGIQLTKSLGQNFLHDANQVRRIVEAAELTSQDKVLEIGPGLGSLTERLLEQAGEVLAIEKDARLAEVLEARFATLRPDDGGHCSVGALKSRAAPQRCPLHLHLLRDDALAYLKREPRDWSRWKLVANLPYSVASPILVELACGRRAPQRMVVTLQREVANRLMAQPGDKDYGLLTLLIQLDFEPQGWFKIPAGCFFPKPGVDSACVRLVRRQHPLLPPDQRETFTRIVKRGFSQRRKTMLKLLKEAWPVEALARAFEQLQLPATIRAEAVTLPQFARLSELLRDSASPR
jgi:16S rRNA (adenine1518-N6/adenine1519-N6)-dimethyltransferase